MDESDPQRRPAALPADEPDEVEARVRADIAAHGWHVVLVPPEGDTPGWAHTIGLVERFAHPELLVFGIDVQLLAALLNRLGSEVARGRRFEAGSQAAGVIERHPLAFREVAPRWQAPFLGNAAWHYRQEQVPALQCFWPDAAGRFPWDPDCDPAWRDDQPLLYVPEVQRALSEALIAVLRAEGSL